LILCAAHLQTHLGKTTDMDTDTETDMDTDMDSAIVTAIAIAIATLTPTPTNGRHWLIGPDRSTELDSNKFLMFTLYGDSGNFLIKVNWKVLLCHCSVTHTHTYIHTHIHTHTHTHVKTRSNADVHKEAN